VHPSRFPVFPIFLCFLFALRCSFKLFYKRFPPLCFRHLSRSPSWSSSLTGRPSDSNPRLSPMPIFTFAPCRRSGVPLSRLFFRGALRQCSPFFFRTSNTFFTSPTRIPWAIELRSSSGLANGFGKCYRVPSLELSDRLCSVFPPLHRRRNSYSPFRLRGCPRLLLVTPKVADPFTRL